MNGWLHAGTTELLVGMGTNIHDAVTVSLIGLLSCCLDLISQGPLALVLLGIIFDLRNYSNLYMQCVHCEKDHEQTSP